MSMHRTVLRDLREELDKYIELCNDARNMGEVETYVTISFFAEWAEMLLDVLEKIEKKLERAERHSSDFLDHNRIIGGSTR